MAIIVLVALVVPFLGLPDPVQIDVSQRLAPPASSHPLGQDEYGRDVLSRLIWGARASLAVAFAAAALAWLIGTALGLAGGFLRGLAEVLAVRSMDVVLCFPPILLALLVVTLLGPGAATLIPVLALLYLPGFMRVAYAGVLSVRAQDYVEAQRALGAGPLRIMLRTILPNIGGPMLVQFSLAVASAVVLECGLSFLGLGVVPPAPSWGLMIGAARATMEQAPLAAALALPGAEPDHPGHERALRRAARRGRSATQAAAALVSPAARRRSRRDWRLNQAECWMCAVSRSRSRRRRDPSAPCATSRLTSRAAKRWRSSARADRASR